MRVKQFFSLILCGMCLITCWTAGNWMAAGQKRTIGSHHSNLSTSRALPRATILHYHLVSVWWCFGEYKKYLGMPNELQNMCRNLQWMSSTRNNAVFGCRTKVYKWIGLDGLETSGWGYDKSTFGANKGF